jgi:hypothetical protein
MQLSRYRSQIEARLKLGELSLTELGLERFLQVMPADWRAKIQRHAGGQVVSLLKQEHGGVRLKNLKPRHLELVADNTSIETKH